MQAERTRWTDERIDDLADLIRAMDAKLDRGFDKIDERFDKVDERFERIDERFERLEIRMSDRFERVEAKVDRRIDTLVYSMLGVLAGILTAMGAVVAALL